MSQDTQASPNRNLRTTVLVVFICMSVFIRIPGATWVQGLYLMYFSVPYTQAGELPLTFPSLNLPKAQEPHQTNCGSPSLENLLRAPSPTWPPALHSAGRGWAGRGTGASCTGLHCRDPDPLLSEASQQKSNSGDEYPCHLFTKACLLPGEHRIPFKQGF